MTPDPEERRKPIIEPFRIKVVEPIRMTTAPERAGFGIRAVEVGKVMFGRRDPGSGTEIPAPMELARLALPRRVYTQSRGDYLVEIILDVWNRRAGLRGYRFTWQAPALRHFTATFQPLRDRPGPGSATDA